MSALKLSFIIEAIDRATAPVRAINQRLDTITEPVRKIRASFNSLVRESGLTRLADQVQAVGDKFHGVVDSMKGIAVAGAVAIGAAAAVWLPMKHVIDQGSKINDTAAMLGVASRDFQRLSYALTLDGSSAEDAATAMRFLQKNAVDALSGNKELAVWFRRAGMSADFLKKNLNDPIALVHKLSDAMAKNISPAQRIALMQALLGRGGARNAQTLARGSEELRRLGDEAERLGAVMSDDTVAAMDEAGDTLTRMERAVGGVMNRITTVALPAIEKIAKSVTEWSVANRELIATRVSEFIDRLIINLPQIVDTTMRIVGAVGTAIVVIDKIAQAFGGWDVVATTLAVVLGGKLLFAVGGLVLAIGKLIPTIFTLGVVLLTTPVGWFLGAVALIAGAAYLVYRNWAPIADFFSGLWEGVKGAFTDAFEFIAGKVNAVLEFVQGVILKLDSITPEWVKRWTLPGAALQLAASAVRPGNAPSALPGGMPGGDVSGTINIKIDQEGRARVASMASDNANVDFDVDSGMLFTGA